MEEVWKDVPGLDGRYQASSRGRVKSVDREESLRHRNGSMMRRQRRGVVLSQVVRPCGYCCIAIGHAKIRYVHRLVCAAFHGVPIGERNHVNHLNGNKSDNRPENLEWATRKENAAHAKSLGLLAAIGPATAARMRGARHHNAKVGEADVIEIRRRYDAGARPRDLLREFPLSRNGLEKIIYRKTWTHIKP